MKKHLLYINLDGFAYYLYSNNPDRFPHLRALASSSTFFASCYSSIPSITVPMQVGIVTGKKCGETGNCYQYFDKDTRSIVKTGRLNKSKTVAQLLAENGYRVLSIQQFAVENHGCTAFDEDHLYIQPGGDAVNRFKILQDYYESLSLPGHSFDSLHDMVLFYADDLDSAGHNYKEHQNTEEERVENVRRKLDVIDRELGKTLNIIDKKGLMDSITILLTADHGMVSYTTPSLLPILVDDLSKKTGYKVSSDITDSPDIFLLPTTIECQGYILNDIVEEEKVLSALKQLEYVEVVLSKKDLEKEGVLDSFGDFLISPVKGAAFYIGLDQIPEGVILASHDSLNEEAQHVFALIFSSGEKPCALKEKYQIQSLMDIALRLSSLPVLDKKGGLA